MIRPFAARRLAVWLVLAAVVMRGAVPVGWMPGALTGGTPIVLCTLEGLKTIVLGPDGVPVPADGGAAHADAPCLFAFAPSFFTPPDAAALSLPSFVARTPAPALRVAVSGFPASPQQARAPPVLS